MVDKEFNLSDYIINEDNNTIYYVKKNKEKQIIPMGDSWICVGFVKEFIKRLKEEAAKFNGWLREAKIDKLAGDKLKC